MLVLHYGGTGAGRKRRESRDSIMQLDYGQVIGSASFPACNVNADSPAMTLTELELGFKVDRRRPSCQFTALRGGLVGSRPQGAACYSRVPHSTINSSRRHVLGDQLDVNKLL